MTSIMVVDDDQDLAEMLGIVLTGAGYEVDLVSRGDEVMPLFTAQNPDLVLLDVMLPGLNGVEVCKLIRENSMVPIVMLSAKGDKQDVVAGLEAGADDYMVKPFDPAELVARMKVRLRRSIVEVNSELAIGNLKIDQIELFRDIDPNFNKSMDMNDFLYQHTGYVDENHICSLCNERCVKYKVVSLVMTPEILVVMSKKYDNTQKLRIMTNFPEYLLFSGTDSTPYIYMAVA